MRKVRSLMRIFTDKAVVLIEADAVGVGEDIDAAAVGGRVVADIHRRAQLEDRLLAVLNGIELRRELFVAEHIAHAVVADTVARAELLVGVVIKHAPRKGACDIIIRGDGIQNTGVAEHMLESVLLVIERLGGIHVTAVL